MTRSPVSLWALALTTTRGTHVTEDGGCEARDDATAEVDGEVSDTGEVLAGLCGYVAVCDLVADLVHGKLPDGIRDLSV